MYASFYDKNFNLFTLNYRNVQLQNVFKSNSLDRIFHTELMNVLFIIETCNYNNRNQQNLQTLLII